MPSIIDLRVHSTVGSADSEIQPEALVKQAKEVGLTGVAITEHVAPWSDEDTQRYCLECGLFLYNAREWETDAGHMITIGLSRELSGITSAKLLDIASGQDAFAILCHPFRDFPGPDNYLFGQMRGADALAGEQLAEHPIFQMADAIEILNGGNKERENRLAQEVARLLEKPGVGGSDAHRTPEVGRCATVFEADMIASEWDLLAALRSGRFHAAQREPDGGFVAVGGGA